MILMALLPMVSKMYKKGDIHIANLNPNKGSEVGQARPVLIMQSDYLNEIAHPTIIILPLSTKLIDNSFLRYRIHKQNKLLPTSDILCDQIRSIDISRLSDNVIYSLTQNELQAVEEKVKIILSIK